MKTAKHNSIIIIVLTLILISIPISFSSVHATSDEKNEWSVVLTVSDELDTTPDTVTFGEKHNATNIKDQYDIPKPPPFQPGIRVSMPTNLAEPYDYLWEQYKSTNAIENHWNLSILWFSMEYNTATVTVSWNQSALSDSQYQSIGLYLNDSLQINMLESSSYQYQASSNVPTFFSIQASQKEMTNDNGTDGNGTNGKDTNTTTNDTPGLSVLIILALIGTVALLFSFKKGKL